jgi:hypothetical protein
MISSKIWKNKNHFKTRPRRAYSSLLAAYLQYFSEFNEKQNRKLARVGVTAAL